MVEYWSPKPWVVGSSPSAPAKTEVKRLRFFFLVSGADWTLTFGSPTARKHSRCASVVPSSFISLPCSAASRKTVINCFSLAHLPPLPKNPSRKTWIFSFVSAGHNIICVQRTQHHFEQSENIIAAPRHK